MTPRRIAAALAGATLLALLWWRVFRTDETDPKKQIRALIEQTVRAAEAQDTGLVMESVSERYSGEGLDRRQLHGLVFAHLQQGRWRRIFVTMTAIDLRNEREARARVGAILARGEGIDSIDQIAKDTNVDAYHFDLELALEEDGKWRVRQAEYRRATPGELMR